MPEDFESAFRMLLKSVIREVAVELSNNQRVHCDTRPQQQRPPDDSLLIRSRDAAKRLAISERHLFSLTRSGALPCVRIGQCIRYSVETIQQWIRDSEAGSVPTPQATPTPQKREPAKKVISSSPKSIPKKAAKRDRANAVKPPRDIKQEAVVRSRGERDATKTEQQERSSPFDQLLQEIGVDRQDLPTVTNGELRRIAEVDVATMHGWIYLNRELPEAALEKLRVHFSNWRAS